jgi:hypothetical protein
MNTDVQQRRYAPPFLASYAHRSAARHIISIFVAASEVMSLQHIVLRPDQHEPALNVVGTQVTVLVSNVVRQSYVIILQQGEEGTGRPPHRHD